MIMPVIRSHFIAVIDCQHYVLFYFLKLQQVLESFNCCVRLNLLVSFKFEGAKTIRHSGVGARTLADGSPKGKVAALSCVVNQCPCSHLGARSGCPLG